MSDRKEYIKNTIKNIIKKQRKIIKTKSRILSKNKEKHNEWAKTEEKRVRMQRKQYKQALLDIKEYVNKLVSDNFQEDYDIKMEVRDTLNNIVNNVIC